MRIVNPSYQASDWNTLLQLLGKPQFNFKHFNFYEGNLNGSAMALTQLLKSRLSELETINLSRTTLSAQAINSAIQLLKDAPNLQGVNFSHSIIDPTSLAQLVDSRRATLTYLALTRMAFVNSGPSSSFKNSQDQKLVKISQHSLKLCFQSDV